MPTYLWLLIWAVALATVTALVVLERRRGRRLRQDRERLRYETARPALNEHADRHGMQGGTFGF